MNIEQVKSLNIVYSRRVGIYGKENQRLMDEFKKWIMSKGLFEDSTILGIALDDPRLTSEEKCRYDVALVVDAGTELKDINQRTLVGGKYAVFKIKHTEVEINRFYKRLGQMVQRMI